jgi:hypothetical protein
MKSLRNQNDQEEVLGRLRRLRPDSTRRWGRMSPHQMVCHLSDSFLMAFGEKEVSSATSLLHRTVVKWIALKSPLQWPPGIKTRPEVDQEVGGTRPAEFGRDVEALLGIVERFTRQPREFVWHPHPTFGTLTDEERMRWGYLHMDHHLRQFGL